MWLCRRQTDCLITLTWAGGECWSCRQGGVAEAQSADPVRRFASLQVKPCKLDFDAALLTTDLATEDAVQAAFQRDLAQHPNGARWSSSFAEPLAFAGGARQLIR